LKLGNRAKLYERTIHMVQPELGTPPLGRHEVIVNAQLSLERLADAQSIPALAESFDAALPPDYSELATTDKLALLKGFSNEWLDVRKGKERQHAERVTYTPEQESAIAAFTEEFEMEGETDAQRDQYAAAEVQGGIADEKLPDGTIKTGSMSLRVDKLAREIERGVEVPYIFLLSSSRSLSRAELAANPGAATEFDALNAVFERRFGVDASDPNVVQDYTDFYHLPEDKEAWSVRHYDLPDGRQAFSVCAPIQDGNTRANTTDTAAFVQRLSEGMFEEGDTILNVTTDIYRLFQHLDVVRLQGLPQGVNVESVGYGGIQRTPDKYAAEINAAINKAVKLDAALQQDAEAA
jgi:hypothetical protein